MPMPNNNFQWRPNDRGATTMLRYRVEAERWTEGLKSAISSQTRNNPMGPFIVINQILTLLFCMMIFLFLGIKYLLVFIFGAKPAPEKPIERTELTFDEPIDADDPDRDEKQYYRQMAIKIEERRQLNQ